MEMRLDAVWDRDGRLKRQWLTYIFEERRFRLGCGARSSRCAPLPKPGSFMVGLSCFWRQKSMLYVAYLDEFGHVGPYIAHHDPRYNTHPVFGLGGIVLPYTTGQKEIDFGLLFRNSELGIER